MNVIHLAARRAFYLCSPASFVLFFSMPHPDLAHPPYADGAGISSQALGTCVSSPIGEIPEKSEVVWIFTFFDNCLIFRLYGFAFFSFD